MTRRGNPHMVRGQPSLNPTGKHPSVRGLAQYIASQTDDGKEIIDALLAVARDPTSPKREAQNAWFALLDRFAGRPHTTSELTVNAETRPRWVPPAGFDQLSQADKEHAIDIWRAALLPAGDLNE